MTRYTRKYNKRVGQAAALRAKKNISEYKNVRAYLDAVYRKNKSYIDSNIETFGIPKSKKNIFKDEVLNRLGKINPETGKKYTLKQAIDMVQRSTIVTSSERRRTEVSFTRIKEHDPEAFKKIRKAIGWKNKFNIENVKETWSEGKYNYYRYYDSTTGRDVVITEEISPKSGMSINVTVEYFEDFRYRYLKETKDDQPYSAAQYAMLLLTRTGGKK